MAEFSVPGFRQTMAAYIAQAAQARGIDPNVALRVARAEGLNSDSPVHQSGIITGGVQEPSYGPYQLNFAGGLGNQMLAQTGLDARQPANWKAAVDFALNHAALNGWSDFHGAQAVGLGNWAGIGANRTAQPVTRTPDTFSGVSTQTVTNQPAAGTSPITGTPRATAALSDVPPPAPTPVSATSFAEAPAPTPAAAAANAEATAPGAATKSLNDLPPATSADELRQQLQTIPAPRPNPQVLQQQALAQVPAGPYGMPAVVQAALNNDPRALSAAYSSTLGQAAADPFNARANTSAYFQGLPAPVKETMTANYNANPALTAAVPASFFGFPIRAPVQAEAQKVSGTPGYIESYTNRPLAITGQPAPAAPTPWANTGDPVQAYAGGMMAGVAPPISSAVIRAGINQNPYSTAAPQNLYSGAPAAAANTAVQIPANSVMPYTPGPDNALPGPDLSSGPMPTAQLGIAGASGLQGYQPASSGVTHPPGGLPLQIPTGPNPPLATPDTFPLAYGPDAFHVGSYTPVSDIVPANGGVPSSSGVPSAGGAYPSNGAYAPPHPTSVIGHVLNTIFGPGGFFGGNSNFAGPPGGSFAGGIFGNSDPNSFNGSPGGVFGSGHGMGGGM